MDRLSSLLELFSPKTQKVELLSRPKQALTVSADSAIGIVYRGKATLSDYSKLRIKIGQGDILWITPKNSFNLESEDPNFHFLCCHLRFGPVRLNPLYDMIPDVLHLQTCDASEASLSPIIELLLQESLQQRCGQETVLNRLAEVLLVHVLRYVMKHQKLETGVLAGLADTRLARAITAIHQHPEQRWSIQTLANEAGMSRTAFNQYFRDTVGCTPGEYLLQWRMRLACRWLETRHVVISQIVDQLGYQSETAFFRAFRRQIGMSPGQYREQAVS